MEHTVYTVRQQADTLLNERERILIAIDGSCTAGKTTLAAALADCCDCNVLHMDDFFLRPEQRTPERLAEAGGNVDYERFREEVLEPLRTGRAFSYCPYDCSTGRLKEPVYVTPKRINIIEGTYSQHPYFGEVYDLRVFLTVSESVRTARILQRPAFLRKRFFEEWIPMEQRYFKHLGIEAGSDIVMLPEDNK